MSDDAMFAVSCIMHALGSHMINAEVEWYVFKWYEFDCTSAVFLHANLSTVACQTLLSLQIFIILARFYATH